MLTLKTAPTEEPVTLTDFVAHMLLDSTLAAAQEGDLIAKLLDARVDIEEDLGRPLITSTWIMTLGGWPCRDHIELLANTQSITSVTYTDSAGASHTLSTDVYKLVRAYDPATTITDAGVGLLTLKYNQSWPSETLDTGLPISIEFVAGWKDATAVPQPIKTWIEMRAATRYRNREDVTLGNTAVESKPFAVPANVSPYRIYRF